MKITKKLTVFCCWLLATAVPYTESQVKLVNGLAVAGDSVAAAPSVCLKSWQPYVRSAGCCMPPR